MPIFEFCCETCNKSFEKIGVHEEITKAKCPICQKLCEKSVPTKMTFHLLGRCWSGDGYTNESPERKKSLVHKKRWDQVKKNKGIETPKALK
ncbi:MAG: FmdB family zinc ribbon protein [Promethearchaeota archaeon]